MSASVHVLQSNGEDEARAYAEVEVQPSSAAPAIPLESVAVTDPRETPTVRIAARTAGAGPRNPEQKVLREPSEPDVELPDGLPATEAQAIVVPPELAAAWREEAKRKGIA